MGKSQSINRVDGIAKVTGTATYAAEYQSKGMVYGFLVGSTIAKGRIKTIDIKKAEWAPGVIAVLTYLNAPKIPGYQTGKDPAKPPTTGQPLRIFYDNEILYYDQPIAMVIADTFERGRHAAMLIKATYTKAAHQTNLESHLEEAKTPTGPRFEDYTRGEADAYKKGIVTIAQEYVQPIEVHNPMELGSIIASWQGEDQLTVYTKTQGVESTRRSLVDAFKLTPEKVTVHAEYVGGAFGMALRTWPYEIAAVLGAKKVGRPLKLVLHREQMFTNVGSRPITIQKMGLGATRDGKLTGLTHEAIAQTSTYEDFTEATVNISRFLYACPNVTTRYKLVELNTCTPIWMRGPGEATGAFALESAMDEMAHALKMDPLEFRLVNHADQDPEKNIPWSSKYLKECYEMGADHIGWKNRKMEPGTLKEGDWLTGYGMGTGSFGAFRNSTSVKAKLLANGRLVLECSVNDMGPGTATMMTAIAAKEMDLSTDKITIKMGSTGLPPGPTQGGSATTSSVGSAVVEACAALKAKQGTLEKGTELEVTVTSKGGDEMKKYSMYSFSVHFVKLQVHPETGMIRLNHVVSCADAGTIINEKTAAGQMSGGAVGGIGMAMMEDLVIDHRFGRPINNNLADYHVPVNADIPKMEVFFVNKKDPYTNPMGSKGLGEISLVGMAPAIANAVFNATGKRIRTLPITPDKLI
ncbi:xanthine dehydrogenase YagR molybdenum-binding subunit [Pedobacter sp. CAN_A7]|uniref:xanthine dehydrogenase family protein molybdopterin-binding subunit n=1 Tax=Pedobacter sp. CAN_A7 TaxID=2787722 RepID=UPI0018CA349F